MDNAKKAQSGANRGVGGLARRDFLRISGGVLAAGVAPSTLAACGGGGGSPKGPGQGDYPIRPINMIVPYGTGGGSDQLARTVGPFAAKELGVSVPVQNVPGANGSVGLSKLAKAAPDGYTIGTYIADNTASAAFGGTPWQPDQLSGICRLMDVPSFLFVNAKSKYKKIEDVLKDAKAKPGSIRMGTVGRQSVDEVSIRMIEQKEGVKFKLVPFSEPTDRYKSLLNGEVEVLYEQGGDVRQYIDGGQFTPILVFREEKFDAFPKVPTSKSFGWPVYFSQYRGIMAPTGTSESVRKTLYKAFKTWADSSKYDKFAEEQLMSKDSFKGPDFFQKQIAEDIKTFKKFIKQLNLG